MNSASIPFVNIHTHHVAEEHTIAIYNAGLENKDPSNLISSGIHPWYIKDFNERESIVRLSKRAGETNVMAIGECGLDKNTEVSMDIQEHFFRDQIRIAQQVNKPLIIHCVKGFNELIRIKKDSKASVPFIVHGFNNNKHIAKELMQNGFILSFGKALLTEGSNAQKIIKDMEADSFLLETDDAPVSIISIFEKAAELRKTSVEALKEQMLSNFKSIFKYG